MRSGRAVEGTAKSPLRVLFFEDCDEDVELCLRALKSDGFHVQWDVAVTPGEVMERASKVAYDVILSDYRMPAATGMDVFELMRSEGIQTPFILVTGALGDEKAIECLKRGVADYVLKDRLTRLPFAVRRARKEERLKDERRLAEERLRSSEASYRSLIQSAPCGILRLSAEDGRLLDANAALAGMLGYDSAADLIAGSAAGGIALDSGALAVLRDSGAAGGVVECEVGWKRKNGSRLLVRLAGRLLRDDREAASCIEVIAENITERHAAEHRIEQLNRLYSVLMHANQAIARTRESGALFEEICRIIVQEGGFQMAWVGMLEPATGAVFTSASWPRQEEYLKGLRITSRLEPEGLGPTGRAIRQNRHIVCNDLIADLAVTPWQEGARRRCFRSAAAVPIVRRSRSIGAITIYAAETNFFDSDNVSLLAELAADVSFALAAIEAERMRRRVASQLDQFFALALDLLCISDLNGSMQRLNPSWEKMLGFSAAEICSKPWVEFVHPEDRHLVREAYQHLNSGTAIRNLELRFLSKDGSCKWLVGCATPALDQGLVFAAMSDITELKQLEEQLRSQNLTLEERSRRIEDASRLKSEFLANMSHELRSPLNGIIGFSELLFDGKLGALPARPREFVGRIHASASHLLQLINGVLDLSKVEAGQMDFRPERLFVSHIVQEVTGILGGLAASKQIRIETEIEAEADEVTVDAGRLRQVLYNYLSNALKFTDGKGCVSVRAKSESATEFRLEVSDTGPGISEKDMAQLFVKFHQLDATAAKRFQGTGLGLALTKRIVEAQGGRVGVDSRLGEGSTFFAILPRGPLPAGGRVAKLLVIDDNYLDRFLLTNILQSNGYLVELAVNGAEAIDKCREEPFDAITLDLVLPDGPGWELLARIRSLETQKKTPVIVISSCGPEDIKSPIEVQGFLTKPVHPDRLLAALTGLGVPMRTGKTINE
ncbi:MAG: response regulator [Bryobacteraceae bacterium]|jgi:PAS domain S-box-containing protein